MSDLTDHIDLPQGWKLTTLGEVVPQPRDKIKPTPDSTLKFIGMDHIEPGETKLCGVGRFAEMKSAGVKFEEDDVLFGRLRPYLNKVYRADFKGACSAEFIVLPASDQVDSDFLKYRLHSREFINFASHPDRVTGDRPRVSFDTISDFPVWLPPVSEQRRIASKIDELFSEIENGEANLKRVQALVEKYRQSVLKAAVTGELTRDWREKNKDKLETGEQLLEHILHTRRVAWEGAELEKLHAQGKLPENGKWKEKYKKPAAPDLTDLPELPDSWVWATVDQLASPEPRSIVDGPFGSNLKTSHYTKKGPRVVRLENIGPGYFIDHMAHISPNHFLQLVKHQALAGDILIASLGTPVPRACIVPDDLGKAIVKADCIRFRTSKEVNTLFLMHCLNSDLLHQVARKSVHGVGRPRLNLGDIRMLPIPLAPVNEQNEIKDRVETFFSQSDHMETEISDLNKIVAGQKQSILKAAFSGKLVPQNSNDEPASVLLERIAMAQST